MRVCGDAMTVIEKLLNRNAKRITRCRVLSRRACAMGLALVMVLTSLTLPSLKAEAAEQGTATTNGYLLEVATGVNAGSAVEFLEIRYTGTDNKKHKQFIFPNEDSLENSYKLLKTYGDDKGSTDWLKGWNFTSEVKPPWETTAKGLQTNSVDQYFFTTEVPIKSVQRLEGFLGSDRDWTCTRMQLYKVNRTAGLKMAMQISDTWYLDFDGDLIAELTNQPNNWRPAGGVANYMRTDQKAVLRTNFSGISYAHHSFASEHAYGIRMDFADVVGGGFDCLMAQYSDGTYQLSDAKGVAETMTLTVTYLDAFGKYRFVRIPVIMNTVVWSWNNGVSSASEKKVWGIGQQGETIAFAGKLPDCMQITKVEASIGSFDAMTEAKLEYSGSNGTQVRRVNQGGTDDIRLTCMAVYDMSKSSMSVTVDGAQLSYDFTGDPILYRVSGDSKGDLFRAGNGLVDMKLRNYEFKDGQDHLSVPDNNEYYLIQITTDDIAAAATKSDLYMRLNYVNAKGNEASTGEVLLRSATEEYYGTWPGDTDNFVYKWGVNSGNTLTALMTLKDVDYFTGVRIRMKEAPTGQQDDDYQCKSFQIYAVTSLGKRKVTWQSGYDKSLNGMHTRVNVTRQFNGKTSTIKILDFDKRMLVQQDQELEMDFESLSVENIVENSFDITDYRISYEEAMQDFNFTKARKTYTVTVNVFDDSVATDDYGNVVSSGGNGDAGSENLFYFQLLFEDGSSCYELANQQLMGDRFASGAAESFQISTNQDYGEVTGIRIIPDDTSEDSKKYDKLRIDNIKVTETGVTGTHDCWVANDVGWIGVAYTEEQEKTGPGGRKGRTAAEMGKTKTIDYTTKVVQLEVAIHTNETEQDEGYASQFHGRMYGQFTIVQNNGERRQLETFDLVEKIYEYRNKKSGNTKGYAVSDKTSMFRTGHTDRFYVDIDDVQEVVALDLTMEQLDNPYNWAIGGVSLRLITEKGVLRINTNDEYDYQRDTEPEVVCTQRSEGSPAHLVKAKAAGKPVTENIPFTENYIDLGDEYKTKTSKITRVPASQGDELNVFIFPREGGNAEPFNNYNLDIELNYAHVYGPIYYTGGRMKKYTPPEGSATGRKMFYMTGLKAEGMIDLNKVSIKANTGGADVKMCYLDYAIIQQVRSGVVIANYYIDCGDVNYFYGQGKFATTDPGAIGYKDQQRVTFQFGITTQESNLIPDKVDMAVALRYKLANDPNNTEYLTPYVFLSDQNVDTIRAGQVVDLIFNQMFVGEITGLRLATIGDIEATVDAAFVSTARTDTTGKPTHTEHYSFGNGVIVTTAPITIFKTAVGVGDPEAVRCVSFAFKTSEAGKTENSGTDGPVYMRLYTADANGVVNAPVEVDDIRRYMVGGGENFETDQLQYVRFLVKGATSIRRIELMPRSADYSGTAGWTLDYAMAQMDGEAVDKRIVGERIYEGTLKRITFANVTVKANTWNWNDKKNAYDQKLVQDKTAKMIALAEKPFLIQANVTGSELGYVVTAVEVMDDEYESGELTTYLKRDGSSYVFTPPKEEDTKYYRITVASAEVPEAKVVIELSVKGIETPAGTGTGTGTGTGESSAGGAGTGESSGSGTGTGESGEGGTGTGEGGGSGTGTGESGEGGAGTGEGSGA